MNELLRSYEVSAPDHKSEVIVVCKDNSCYVATYYDVDQWNDKPRWFVAGPLGCPRRLQKKVLWWMPRPHLPDEEGTDA